MNIDSLLIAHTLTPLKYQALIGVGGVGTGQFFEINGSQTLGREESRSGHFLERRDYCKLHIIAHYVKTLLGPTFTAIPVSKIGVDDVGRRLRMEMENAGLDLRFLTEDPSRPTLFSFSFSYPDGSGGNLTTDNSAVDGMEVQDLDAVEPEFARFESLGIALAAPEAPPSVRLALLRYGARHQSFCVAGLTTAEAGTSWAADLLSHADLVALNIDEAAGLANLDYGSVEPERVVAAAVASIGMINPRLKVSITAGADGSWTWDGDILQHIPAFPVQVINTAGAGDAHLAGILAGLSWGLQLRDAQEIGTLVAAQSITSPHTIHPGIRPEGLFAFARQIKAPVSNKIGSVLADLAGNIFSGDINDGSR